MNEKHINKSLCESDSTKNPSPCEIESQVSPLPCGGGLGVGIIPQDYKQTSIGTIPQDWEQFELGDIISIDSTKFNTENSKSQPCIELEHLSQDTGQILGFTESKNQKSIKNSFKKGQILFGKLRPYLRKFWRAKFDGVCSSEIWVMSGKKISNDFLFYLIQTEKFTQIANVSTGTKMPRADWDYMQEIPFSIPPLKEQEKIARILGVWDSAIDSLANLIKAKRKYKTALMQRLLTPPRYTTSCHTDTLSRHTSPSCHTERSEVSKSKSVDFVDTSAFSKPQYDKVLDSCNDTPLCHTASFSRHTEGVARSIQKDDLQGNDICLDSSLSAKAQNDKEKNAENGREINPQNDKENTHNDKKKIRESSLRFAGFSDKWQEFRLGDIVFATASNLTLQDIKSNGKFPVFGANGLVGYADFYQKENEYLGVVKDGAGVGRTYFLPKKSSALNTLQYIETNQANIKFIYYLFLDIKWANWIKGSTIPHIFFNDYKNLKIKIPTLVEQKKIAQVLSACDKEIETLNLKFECLKAQKRGLMQQLLSGKVRVKC